MKWKKSVHKDRISFLLKAQNQMNNKYVIYWMQQSQRVFFNHGFKKAVEIANEKKLPLIVCFTLSDQYLGANLRHYQFMLEGLQDVKETLFKQNINFLLRKGGGLEGLQPLLADCDTLVMDFSYFKIQLNQRKSVYQYLKEQGTTNLYMVESDVLIPVRSLYPKSAYGAYVIRPHVLKHQNAFIDFKEETVYQGHFYKMDSDYDLFCDIMHINVFIRIKDQKHEENIKFITIIYFHIYAFWL